MLGALVLAASCGEATEPRWVSLVRATPTVTRSNQPLLAADGRTFLRRRVAAEPGAGVAGEEVWLTTVLEHGDWTFEPGTRGGAWSAPLGLVPAGSSAAGVEARLADFAHRPKKSDPSTPWRFEAGCFALLPGRLLLKLAPDVEPPPVTVLEVFAGAHDAGATDAGTHGVGTRDARVEGAGTQGPGTGWRLRGRRFSGDGFAVTAGDRVELEVVVPPGAELRFATVLEPALAPPTAPREPVRFRVEVDGREVFRHEERELGAPLAVRHAVALEAGPQMLAFAVDGGFAYSGFLAPRLVPSEVGSYADRPWDAGRPDLVVFLADTLRADALAAYGGELGVTPHLDELASRSLVFERAWSTGTYTLPAHASMFAGVFPHQAGIVGTGSGVPESFVTIAEHLRDHGYRTGAITDSVIVTEGLGLAQGFEWFDELHGTLGLTLERARAFLDDDDGRPVFLFVHTYRTHLPYRVGKRTREAWGERLGIAGDPDRLRARIQELLASPPDAPGRAAAITDALARLEPHYWGGVVDLDDGFRRFHEDLVERGLLDRGRLVFASDHGEAFGENGALYHREKVWDVVARVPLFVHGAGIEPGVVPFAASLVDLPATLAALAGVPARDEWHGTSLLALDAERPTFVFECTSGPDSTLAVVDGPRKVIAYESAERLAAGELLGAFDLGRDPAEAQNLAGDAAWPRDVLARFEAELRELLVPLAVTRARLSASQEDELRAMGYGGDDGAR